MLAEGPGFAYGKKCESRSSRVSRSSCAGDATVRLESFIVSSTPSHEMKMLWGMEKTEMSKRHILFQGEEKETYVRRLLEQAIAA